GVSVGMGALVSLQADWLCVVVGLGSLVVASVLLWSHATTASYGHVSGTPPLNDQPRRTRWAIWVAGFVSGILSGGLGMPGPPIMVLLQYAGMPKHTYRATALGYFTLIYPCTLLVMAAPGVLCGQHLAW